MSTHAPAGTTTQLDPSTLEVAPNVRKKITLSAQFVKTVKQLGVLEAVSVYWDDDLGKYLLTRGQRRRAAAEKAGLTSITAVVVEKPTQESLRIIEQFVENEHREAITTVERAQVFLDLELEGMPAIEIASKTGTKLDQVGDALKVAKNPAAMTAAAQYQLTNDDAFIVAEFADSEQALITINHTLQHNPQQLAHVAQRLRDDRDRNAEIQKLLDQAAAAGLRIADAPRRSEPYEPGNKHRALTDLLDGTTGEPLEEASHSACEGHAAWVGGKTRYDQSVGIYLMCTDPARFGHKNADAVARSAMTDEQRAAKKLERENKAAWIAASTVRRNWIGNELLVPGRELPKGTDLMIAKHLTGGIFKPSNGGGTHYANDWLDANTPMSWSPERTKLGAWLASNPSKARNLALAVALSCMEDVIGEPKGDTRGWSDNRGKIGPYLATLVTWGYIASPIERQVIEADDARNAKRAA
jgi:ParB family chromosome partitioning protein